MSYATIGDIRAKVSIRTIDGNSDPSVQEVVSYIDQIAADIDTALAGQGYDVPVSASSTTAFSWLGLCNAYGAAMLTEAASAKGKESPHLEFLERQYERRLKQIMDGEITLPGVAPATSAAVPRAGGKVVASALFMATGFDQR